MAAGLIALDGVLDERTDTPPRLWAGGTCGNILSILAFPGWRSLPISIVHRIRENSAGEPFHSFSLNCPDCGRHLPSYRPVPASSLDGVLPQIPKPSVLFADRVSRGVITLAQSLRERGALVVFEPSGVSDPSQFAEMLALTHVLARMTSDREEPRRYR